MKYLLLVFILMYSQLSLATTYYIQANGDNTDPDCSESTPCCSGAMDMSDFNAASFSGDDVVYVCDDNGVYYAQMNLPTSGASGHPITLSAYPGDLPVINGSDSVSGSWADQGSNIWRKDTGAITPWLVVFNTTNIGIENDVGPAADYEWRFSGSNLFVYAESDPDVYYSSIEIGQRIGINTNGKDYWDISGVHITKCQWLSENGSWVGGGIRLQDDGADDQSSHINITGVTADYMQGFGISIRGSSYVSVSNSTFDKIECQQIGSCGDGILIGQDKTDLTSSSNIEVTGCTFGSGADSIDRWSIGVIDGDDISIHDNNFLGGQAAVDVEPNTDWVVNNLAFYSNTGSLYQNTRGADELFAIILTETSGGTINGTISIEDNQFDMNNATQGTAIDLLGGGSTNTINNNTMLNCRHGIFANDDCSISRNYLTGGTSAVDGIKLLNGVINAKFNVVSGFQYAVYDDGDGDPKFLYNNSLYDYETGFHITLAPTPTVTMKNNIFGGTSATYQIRKRGAGSTIVSDYNIFAEDGSTHFDFETTQSDFAGWKTNSGQDANSTVADPLFSDAPSGGFQLKYGSPAINKGVNPFVDGDGDQTDFAGVRVWDDVIDALIGGWFDGTEIGAYGVIKGKPETMMGL